MSDGKRKRNRNGGIRKRCGCPVKQWPKCPHSWHFNFKWRGVHYRLGLDRETGRHIDSKSDAQAEADRIRTRIRAGEHGRPESSATDTRPTFGAISDIYLKKHVALISQSGEPRRPGGRALMELHVKMLRERQVTDGRGGTMPFSSKPLDDLTVADIEAIREGWPLLTAAGKGGRVGADKALKRLRHFCNWAVERGYTSRTPFKTGNGVVAVHFVKEQPRSRRLEGDEEDRLQKHADVLLRALIIAALETACRKGELLGLRWRDVKWEQNILLILASVSKTAEARDVPMTQRLRSVLELRRYAPDGSEHQGERMFSGTRSGSRLWISEDSGSVAAQQRGSRGWYFTISGGRLHRV